MYYHKLQCKLTWFLEDSFFKYVAAAIFDEIYFYNISHATED